MSDDMPEVARLLGRQLGLGLIQNEPKPAGVTLRYATVDAVHSDGGTLTADLTVAGGELHAVPMTTDCVNLQPGDRCIVETANHLSIITGILARTGAIIPAYRAGDTISVDYNTAGYITNSGKNMYCTLPLNRPLAGVTAATCTKHTASWRQGNGYLIGASDGFGDAKPYTTLTIIPETGLGIRLAKNSAWPNATNNSPVGCQGSITLTLQ